MSDGWTKANIIASWVIAIFAVLGFVLSLRSSREVSRALVEVTDGMTSLSTPLVKWSSVMWISNGNISCSNPPIGIKVFIKNVSSVPVEVHDLKVEYYFGEKRLEDSVSSANGKETILASNEAVSSSTIQSEAFQKYLRDNRSFITNGPSIEFQITAKYSRLNDQRLYRFTTRQKVMYDCQNPALLSTYAATPDVNELVTK